MRIMPRAAPCLCALRMQIGHVDEMSERSRTTTVESSMKSEHNLYLACEDSTTCFFLLNFSCSLLQVLALFASTVH